MLTKFKVKNFKNFQNELELDLENVKNYEFSQETIRNRVIKTALVYGENGSGKTNLGEAIFDIIIHITDKQKSLGLYNVYGNLNIQENTEFAYEFKFAEGKLRYEYKKKSAQELISEAVYVNDQLVILSNLETDEHVVKLKGAESLKTNIFDGKMSFVKYIYYNSVLQENEENSVFIKFIEFVQNMLWFSSLERNEYQGFRVGSEKIAEGIIERDKVKEFQTFLEYVGINYQLVIRKIDEEKVLCCKFEGKCVNFFNIASRGTCSLALFFYWLIQLDEASFVFIDEFDAFYHNNLAETVVKEMIALKDTQSILTTHNTDIMTNDLLRPDCYFIIVDGKIRSFSDSTNKELRKAHNLQKMYNAGAFYE